MMTAYKDFAPTPCDHAGAFLSERQDWIVVPCSQTRDSNALEKSNFTAALTMLGGESDTVEVHRFGHWGPGWFEIILVVPSRAIEVEEIAWRLEDYPVLDEEAFSALELEDEQESWDAYGRSDWIDRLTSRAEDLGIDHPEYGYLMLDFDIVDALWAEVLHRSGAYVEHNSDGAYFPTKRASAVVEARDLVALARNS